MKRPEALDTLRELDKQAPHPTHVTAFRPEADPNEEVWTLSNNPDDEGWSTDGGYSGYGMTKAMAAVYAEARNALPDILAYVAHLEGALNHIRSLDEDTMHLDRPMMERCAVLFSTALAVANEALGWPPTNAEQTPAESRPTE